MDFADEARNAVRLGDSGTASKYFGEAYELDSQAAALVLYRFEAEPTRAILFNSAASLAYEAGRYRDAEKMLCAGLAGDPPADIAEDMRDLLEKVNFGRHLELRGAALAQTELRMSMAGKGVSFGVVQNSEFAQRLQLMDKLLIRTAERIQKTEFRTGGVPKKAIRDSFNSFVQAPMAASFAITFRVAEPKAQMEMDELTFVGGGAYLVQEVISCMELFNQSDEKSLRARLGSDEYYNNFIAIAQQIAPDGKDIEMVGFTANIDGIEHYANLTRTEQFLSPALSPGGESDVLIGSATFSGELRGASSRKPGHEAITIVQDSGKVQTILVPSGVSDIVKPYWEEVVEVQTNIVKRSGRRAYLLHSIRPGHDTTAS
jgi:hypothetical protein